MTPGLRRPLVAIVDIPDGGYVDTPDVESDVLDGVADARVVHVEPHALDVLHTLDSPCIVLWHRVALTAKFFELNRACRTVICASVGYDHVDIAAAGRYGVQIFHVPQYGTGEVADHTLALALALLRRLPALHDHVRDGGWDWRESVGVRRLQGSRWGVVGLGRIGLAVAKRAAAFGMHVGFHDPYAHPGIEKSLDLTRFHDLGGLLAASSVVSLHVPLTSETRHLIDGGALRQMRPGAVLVNTSRGAVVEVAALADALGGDRLAGVALDVVEDEPDLPAWLCSHPRVLLTPHSAFYSVESLVELRTRAASAARDVLTGAGTTSAVRIV